MGAFIIACLIVELAPGPNMGWLATLSMTYGRRAGLAAVAGIALGLATVGILVSFGLDVLIVHSPAIYGALRWGGVLWLAWLAIEAWRQAESSAYVANEQLSLFAAFRRGLVTNLLNPKAAIFYALVLPGFAGAIQQTLLRMEFVLLGIYLVIATSVHASIALFAARLRPLLMGGPREKLVRRIMAAMLAAFAVWFAVSTRRGEA